MTRYFFSLAAKSHGGAAGRCDPRVAQPCRVARGLASARGAAHDAAAAAPAHDAPRTFQRPAALPTATSHAPGPPSHAPYGKWGWGSSLPSLHSMGNDLEG
jgi:hypothetical protein